jgi:hypothetical protein
MKSYDYSKRIEVIDFPIPPSNLIESLEDVLKKSVALPANGYVAWGGCKASPELVEWLQNNLPCKINPNRCRYVIVEDTKILIHRDHNLSSPNWHEITLNFVIRAGGEAVTTLFDSDIVKDRLYGTGANILQQIIVKNSTWVKFPVTIPHSVANITEGYRFMLRVDTDPSVSWDEIK